MKRNAYGNTSRNLSQNGSGEVPVRTPPLGPRAGRLCEPHASDTFRALLWPLKLSSICYSPTPKALGVKSITPTRLSIPRRGAYSITETQVPARD